MKSVSRWLGVGALLAFAMLAGCGGGGGGGDGTPPVAGGPAGSGGGPPAPSGPAYAGFDFSLAAGDYWRFGWDAMRSSFAQGSGTTSETKTSQFQVKLGSPTTIAGVQMYPIQLSGNPAAIVNGDPVSLAPRWLYVGMDSSRVLGSTDGATLTTVFDANSGKWGGDGGFFTVFPASTLITTQPMAFSNAYITDGAAVRAGRSTSKSQCEVILGITFCGDDAQTFTDEEFYKQDVGPIAYHHLNSFSFCGGNFCSGGTHEYNLGLIASSRRGDSVASALEVEPNNKPAQAMPLSLPATVDGAALNETAYGGPTIVPNENDANNSFAAAQVIALPAWIGGTVQVGDANTSINIPAQGTVGAYTATFEDFYRFTAAASGTVSVRLNFPSGTDLDIYVFTLSGVTPTIVTRGITDNIVSSSFTEFASFSAAAGTTYYVAVDGFTTPAPASYELMVYSGTPPASRGVVDWFRVDLAAPKTLNIGVTGGPGILLTNSTGTTLIQFAIPSTPGASVGLSTALAAGTYLIGLTEGGAYRLTVN